MTEENQLIEVTVGKYKRKEIFEWAVETFGDKVELHDSLPLLYFRSMADVEFFMLRWG